MKVREFLFLYIICIKKAKLQRLSVERLNTKKVIFIYSWSSPSQICGLETLKLFSHVQESDFLLTSPGNPE